MGGFRVTYATLTADDAELQAAYTAAVESVRGELGATHPLWVGDDERFGNTFTTVSPLDTSVVVGHFSHADAEDVDEVVAELAPPSLCGRRRRGRSAATSSTAPRI